MKLNYRVGESFTGVPVTINALNEPWLALTGAQLQGVAAATVDAATVAWGGRTNVFRGACRLSADAQRRLVVNNLSIEADINAGTYVVGEIELTPAQARIAVLENPRLAGPLISLGVRFASCLLEASAYQLPGGARWAKFWELIPYSTSKGSTVFGSSPDGARRM